MCPCSSTAGSSRSAPLSQADTNKSDILPTTVVCAAIASYLSLLQPPMTKQVTPCSAKHIHGMRLQHAWVCLRISYCVQTTCSRWCNSCCRCVALRCIIHPGENCGLHPLEPLSRSCIWSVIWAKQIKAVISCASHFCADCCVFPAPHMYACSGAGTPPSLPISRKQCSYFCTRDRLLK